MRLSSFMRFTLCVLLASFLLLPSVYAAIAYTGDVSSDPSTWASPGTTGVIGISGPGTGIVTIDGGSVVNDGSGQIGQNAAGNGTVNVDGTGSLWNNDNTVSYGVGAFVGRLGTGTLNITNGGAVSVSAGLWAGFDTLTYASTGTGTINFGTGGGTLTTASLAVGASQLTGTGTVNARGIISDVNLTLTSGTLIQSFPIGGVTVNLDMGTAPANNGYLGAGQRGTGVTNILTSVSSSTPYIGVAAGSNGTVNVDGTTTVWTLQTNSIGVIGVSGTGALNVTNGAQVNGRHVYLGKNSGSSGSLTIDGTGSFYKTNTQLVYVGDQGAGNLSITNGGVMWGMDTKIGNQAGMGTCSATIDGTGSQLKLWNGLGSYNAIVVGNARNGSLMISNGGNLTSAGGTIGATAGVSATATVDGSGSTWTYGSSGALIVGSSGTGTLNITNGGAVSDTGLNVSGNAAVTTSKGTINIDGTGSTLTNSGAVIIGYAGSGGSDATAGTVKITNGGQMIGTSTAALGGTGNTGSKGIVIVDGTNSKWTGTTTLSVGQNAVGTLTVSNGGAVSSTGGSIGINSGSNGTVTVDGLNSLWKLTTASAALGFNPTGSATATLNITNGGSVQTGYGTLGQNSGTGSEKVVIDGAGSNWTMSYASGSSIFGGSAPATVSITNGGAISEAFSCTVGNTSTGACTVTINGSGSNWTSTAGTLTVGNNGPGTVIVTGGATLSDLNGTLGSGATGVGTVAVDGSTWANTNAAGTLFLGGNGNAGKGGVYISGGSTVSAQNVTLRGTSTGTVLEIDVGRGSALNIGNGGTFTNGLTSASNNVRVVASAHVPAGNNYTPITPTAIWAGSGGYQAVGGTWDTGTHSFTASTVAAAAAGSPDSVDRSLQQRMLINDSTAHTWFGVGLLSSGSSTTLGLTGTTLSGGPLTSLNGLLTGGATVLDGWSLSGVSGYNGTDPFYLSFSLPCTGYKRSGLTVWRYNGTSWSNLSPYDLTYDGALASFGDTTGLANNYAYAVTGKAITLLPGDANGDHIVNINDLSKILANYDKTGMYWIDGDFNGDGTVDISDLSSLLANYDVTYTAGAGIRAVPEPGTVALLAAGLVGLLAYAWRKR
jgi:T5SS/PEP-CTERM-associated repeat protein